MSPHEEFLELCAISTVGELSEEERRKLDEHLLGCAPCRGALKQFQETVETAVSAVAVGLPQEDPKPDMSWSHEKAEAALFSRLAGEDGQTGSQPTEDANSGLGQPNYHRGYFPPRFGWGQLWMTSAAAVLLFLALVISAYRVGVRRGAELATNAPSTQGTGGSSLEGQLSDLSHERENIRVQLVARDKTIEDLRRQVGRLESPASERARNSASAEKSEDSLIAEQAPSAKARLAELQKKLDEAEIARSEDSSRAATLEAKLTELTQQLNERDETTAVQAQELQKRERAVEQQQTQLAEQKELLNHDRDIRELMGARDLYVAEVFDVGKDAATKKSNGRVFFTKGKSLIFYAYDLDRQPGAKDASTFQAWGQRGADRKQALNLGVFYEDNVSKKRWILKLDDTQKLAEIDAVFVTVEPKGGSMKPSSKPFLYAYLKVNPNHP